MLSKKAIASRLKGMKGGYEKAFSYRQELLTRPTDSEISFRNILDVYGVQYQFQYIFVYSYKFFILDFVIEKNGIKYVFEIDGSSHDDKQCYDNHRASIIELYGYKIFRFTNNEVINKRKEVVSKLKELKIIEKAEFDPEDWLSE